MEKVVVTGIGVIANQGSGWQAVRQNALKGEEKFEKIPAKISAELKIDFLIGKIAPYEKTKHFTTRQLRLVDKFLTMSVSAVGFALEDAGLESMSQSDKDNVATFIGTSRPEFAGFQRFSSSVFLKKIQKLNPLHFPLLARNAAGGQIAITFGFRGYSSTVSVNHIAGMHAIARGFDVIQNGRAQIAVVGGVESLSRLSIAHSSLLYRDNLSKERNIFFGTEDALIIPSEGVCILILESESHAKSRGVKPYAEIFDYRMGRYKDPGDLNNAINATLNGGGLKWRDIAVFGCSASGGCLVHDKVESLAIANFIHDAKHCPVISAPKSLFGEAEACSSALQVAVIADALKNKEILPTINYDQQAEFKFQLEDADDAINNGVAHAVDAYGNYMVIGMSKIASN